MTSGLKMEWAYFQKKNKREVNKKEYMQKKKEASDNYNLEKPDI